MFEQISVQVARVLQTDGTIQQRNQDKLEDSLFVSIVTLVEGVAGLLLAVIALVVGTSTRATEFHTGSRVIGRRARPLLAQWSS